MPVDRLFAVGINSGFPARGAVALESFFAVLEEVGFRVRMNIENVDEFLLSRRISRKLYGATNADSNTVPPFLKDAGRRHGVNNGPRNAVVCWVPP